MRVDVSFPTREEGNRSSFQNAVLSSYLDFLTVVKTHKSGDSEEE
jgi:hypothetical protein